MLTFVYRLLIFPPLRSVTVLVYVMVWPGRFLPTYRKVRHILSDQLLCAICCEPVNLEIAKTDDGGNGVHEECYIQKIIRKDQELRQRQSTSNVKRNDRE